MNETIDETWLRVVISDLLLDMKAAIEKMSVHNSHRGIMTTAGSLIIHLAVENQRLQDLLDKAISAGEATKMSGIALTD